MRLVQQWMFTVSLTVLAACSQATPTPDRHTLQAVNGQALPATLLDEIYQDPGVPPYRFRVQVLGGWFKLEGNTYEQEIHFLDLAEGYPDFRWTWREFGTCTPEGAVLKCESGYIQNYRFDIIQQGNTLTIQQDFTDPALKGTFSFSKE